MSTLQSPRKPRRLGRAVVLAAALVQVLAMKAGLAQDKVAVPLPMPDDWTHRHVIFSGARTAEDAKRMANDPRYLHQWLLHNRQLPPGAQTPASMERFPVPGMTSLSRSLRTGTSSTSTSGQTAAPATSSVLTQLWGSSLLAGGTLGDGMFPAKFTSDATGAPSCTDDFAVYNTSLAGGAGKKASGTGTFAASNLAGTVTVGGVVLTASLGTAASQSTTIGSNGVANDDSVTVTNGSSSLTVTASSPVARRDALTYNRSVPSANAAMTFGGVTYRYKSSTWSSLSSVTAGECWIRIASGGGAIQSMAGWLQAAINNGSSNDGTSSTSSWMCSSTANQASNGVTAPSATSTAVNIQAKIPGSTGFGAITYSPIRGKQPTDSTITAGSDGSNVSPKFQYWSGAAPIPNTTTLATNIANAIKAHSNAAAVGITSSALSNVVTITAKQLGTGGNSIVVSTTIASGAPFDGPLSGGGTGLTDATHFATDTDVATEAANLAAAINSNPGLTGMVTASSSSTTVTVTAVSASTPGTSIGTSDALGTSFNWGGTTLTGGSTAATTIVAFNNIYSTQGTTTPIGYCNETNGASGPTLLWSYAIGRPGSAAVTSPVLSQDGTRVMFVETSSSGAMLHILQWKSGDGALGSPIVPATVADISTCPADESCVVNIAFEGSKPATRSAPFYDYVNDALFAGDDNGKLHKFTPVLNGPAAEVVVASVWPVTIAAANTKLTSPVFDSLSDRIFVGDSSGRISYTTPAGAAPASVSAGGTIVDAPLVDSSAGKVFVFGSTSVHQFDTALTAASHRTATLVGASRAGAMDQKYSNGGTGTGNLFVCAGSSSASTHASIYRIPITAGAMSTGAGIADFSPTSAASACSPVAELYNATTGQDRIFFSVGATGTNGSNAAACGGVGCVLSVDVTGTAWPPALASFAAYPVPVSVGASTSGISVDHVAGTTAAPSTSLTSAVANSIATTSLNVVSTSGFQPKNYIQIDSEVMQIGSVTSATTLTAYRGGYLSTATAAHAAGTPVIDLRVALLTLSVTTLDGTSVTVDQHSTLSVGDYIQIDSEVMKITAKPTSTTLTVDRGQLGTLAATHQANMTHFYDLGAYGQSVGAYFSFLSNATSASSCNGAIGVGCAVKVTQPVK